MDLNDINLFFAKIDALVGGSQWFVGLLLFTGLFFTIYLRFPQIRFFRHAIRVVSGKYDEHHHEGDTSHFQSLTAALSGTVGTGNIAGVALAVHLGGPAALFWMFMTAFLGMTTKMVEVTLSHKYREKTKDGSISGGPMYYMRDRLNMKWLAAIFAFATIFSSFGTGSLPQINSISNSMFSAFGIAHWITGAVLAVVLGFIIIGGIKRIVQVTEKLIPFMTIVFLVGALLVLSYNYENIIPSIVSIFTDVFNGTAATGGFLGAGFAWAFNRGVNRGLFSNEAGQGSAPIAHAAARTDEPVSEGMVAILEPFIDTVIICMLTGLVLLSSGVWQEKVDNRFQTADIVVLQGLYQESDMAHRQQVASFLKGEPGEVAGYTGPLEVIDGAIVSPVTLLHARSFGESVVVARHGVPFTGTIEVKNGKITSSQVFEGIVTLSGKSLLHSAPLTTVAFTRSWLGEYGKYIIPICLLLFAFSTAIAWYYYASRAIAYLWGTKYIVIFQIIYVVAFFVASFVDTTIVWTISGITVASMTLPNLFGILLLRKDMKKMLDEYIVKMNLKKR